jgi:hypothetical protein
LDTEDASLRVLHGLVSIEGIRWVGPKT